MSATTAMPATPAPVRPGAVARLDGVDGRVLAGCGPFTALAEPPPHATVFYVNDFTLSAARPWLLPASLIESPPAAVACPAIAWRPPDREVFVRVFDDILRTIRLRTILKAVPVSTARGQVTAGDPPAWAQSLSWHGSAGHAFAWSDGELGFAGLTPEILFRLDGRHLTTMALAGTADAAHADELIDRPKLAREHAIVVDELHRRLSTMGAVNCGPREIVPLGNMLHLRTAMSVTLDGVPQGAQLNDLIRLLHPTPALGISPRTPETMAMLHRWRAQTGTPSFFGAPFGAAWPGGALILVAIRGLFWNEAEIMLPAGGGLVAGSEVDSEWAELELKRAWVRRALGLAGMDG